MMPPPMKHGAAAALVASAAAPSHAAAYNTWQPLDSATEPSDAVANYSR